MNGLPLLSYPPPDNSDGSDETTCRKCNKEFNFIFARQKRCNHCGYAYCSSCADFQALMPRGGPESGYEVHAVCAYCMDMLTVTASGKNKLRSLPLAKLRAYMKAYNIGTDGSALEKDDLVDAMIRARGVNGCLLPAHEEYYRNNSVPRKAGERQRSRGFFSRPPRPPTPPAVPPPSQQQYAPPPRQQFPPPPQQYYDPPPQAQYSPPPGPPPRPQYVPPPSQRQYVPRPAHPPSHVHAGPARYPQQQYNTGYSSQVPFPQPQPYRHHAYPAHSPHSHHSPPPPPPQQQQQHQSHPRPATRPPTTRPSTSQTDFSAHPSSSLNSHYFEGNHPRQTTQPPPRPRSAAPTVPTTHSAPPPPVPSLDSLLDSSPDEISHLSISTLKAVLFENRVNSSTGIIEKEDLVRKVLALVKDEKTDREIAEREEQEEAERMEWARREREAQEEARRAEELQRNLMDERLPHERDKNLDAKLDQSGDDKPKASQSTVPNVQYSDKQEGLCVICCDAHANMAIVDCGHLALCKACSEIVMKTSRECPLCRTRIVTEQRLLRIFKS